MVVRVTFRLYITPKSVKIYNIFLYFDRILAKILAPPKLNTQCEKCPYSELFWSVFSRIRTEYGHFLRSDHWVPSNPQ